MKKIVLPLMICLLTLAFNTSAGASSEPSRAELIKEIKSLKRDVNSLKTELRALLNLIKSGAKNQKQPQKQARGKTTIKGDPSMGKNSAKVVVVEFSDYQCPYCGRYTSGTLPQIKKNYIDTGKVKYVFKDFPLPFHKRARHVARAALCAGESGKYWEMHDLLFEKQKQLATADMSAFAVDIGLDKAKFDTCMKSSRHHDGITSDIQSAKSSGISGTPSFIIGKLNAKGEVEGTIVRGARPFPAFKSAIEAALK